MIKKILALVAALVFIAWPVAASAAPLQNTTGTSQPTNGVRIPATNTTQPEVRSFGGFHGSTGSFHGGSGYSTGLRSPSPSVGRSGYGSSGFGRSGFGGGFGSHIFSFGSGMLLGSMFHPFGGYYGMGGGYQGFSFFSLIIDIIILLVLWKIVRWVFRRR